MLAGMGGVSFHRLVAAVSEAGGFGCLGAATMSRDEMVDEMRAVRAATARPFGIDLLAVLPDDLEEKIKAAAGEGMSLFVAGLGIPGAVIDLCHEAGGPRRARARRGARGPLRRRAEQVLRRLFTAI